MTPETIDRVLAEFRGWLEAAARGPATPDTPAGDEDEPVDLHTLLGQMIALRQEVNLQTRAVRAQQEQGGEALRQLGQALTHLQHGSRGDRAAEGTPDGERALLKALLDVHDALSLAGRESRRIQETLSAALDADAESDRGPQLTGLAGWLARGQLERYEEAQQQRRQEHRAAAGRVRELLNSMATGYAMSIRRVERVLEQFQLEPLETVGRPFDPESMEAVEMVAAEDRAPGEVVDEVRRGYRWRGRLFRYAQVRVAR